MTCELKMGSEQFGKMLKNNVTQIDCSSHFAVEVVGGRQVGKEGKGWVGKNKERKNSNKKHKRKRQGNFFCHQI